MKKQLEIMNIERWHCQQIQKLGYHWMC